MAASPTEKSYSLSTMGSSLKSNGKQSRDLEAATVDDAPSSKVRGWRRYFKPWSCQKANNDDWKIVTRSVESRPNGYPRLAEFLSSDRSFMQYRGFSSLHSRVLLSQQCDIEVLEQELDKIDDRDAETEETALKLQCKTRDDRSCGERGSKAQSSSLRARKEILADLKEQLFEYDSMLLKAKEMASLQRPSERDWRSVRKWLLEKGPLVKREQDFILRREDIVTLRSGREGAGFESLVERTLGKADRFLQRFGCNAIQYLFVTPELREKTSDTMLDYYAPKRVDKLVNVIITAVIFVLLILPVVAMYELSDVSQRASPFEAIGILIVFTLLFGTAMSSLTKATRQELFAASAAYCAVLVVFISNFSTQTVEIAQ